MLPNQIKKKLKANWPKAESMDCNAEIRVYDPGSPWECYIFAMNPEEENEIWCVIHGYNTEVTLYYINALFAMFNAMGEAPIIDEEFRPRNAGQIYRKLTEGDYVTRRD